MKLKEMLDLLKKVKKLKVKELKKVNNKLEVIHQKKMNEWFKLIEKGEQPITPVVDLDDLRDALTYCEYHFVGGLLEDEGLDKCPCSCYCINCEIIPTEKVSIRMQEIARDMGEENVFEEFKREYKEVLKIKDDNGK